MALESIMSWFPKTVSLLWYKLKMSTEDFFLSSITHLPLSIGDYKNVFSIPFSIVPLLSPLPDQSLPKLFHPFPEDSLDKWMTEAPCL